MNPRPARFSAPSGGAAFFSTAKRSFHARLAGVAWRLAIGAMAWLASGCSPAESMSGEGCVEEGRTLNLAFYAFFAPVSASADEDPTSPGFNEHRGYEADLITALEAMDETNLSFERHPIAEWDGIWLKPASMGYDMASGGITILDSRTKNEDGSEVVKFTGGHITFRQSLLVRAENAERIASYEDLTDEIRVGVLPATTGEVRLLHIVGIADADGVLAQGTRIETPDGVVTADGTADYAISAGYVSPALRMRSHLYPPAPSMPQVVYLGALTGEAELIQALRNGDIDAMARGEIGNRDASSISDGAFVVTALDDAIELGGFTLSVDDDALRACIDERIDWLTNDMRTGYAEWRADASVFMQRAHSWNER